VHKQPKKQARKKQASWIARIPKIWQAVIFVLGVPGLYVGILSTLPRISVKPGDLLHSSQPLSVPLVVSNDGILDIHAAKVTCAVHRIASSTDVVMHDDVFGEYGAPFELGDIGADGSATTFCVNFVDFGSPIVEGHMVISVSFRPDFLPWRTARTFHLRGAIGENKSFHWVQTSN
jgi:hypothetical protein